MISYFLILHMPDTCMCHLTFNVFQPHVPWVNVLKSFQLQSVHLSLTSLLFSKRLSQLNPFVLYLALIFTVFFLWAILTASPNWHKIAHLQNLNWGWPFSIMVKKPYFFLKCFSIFFRGYLNWYILSLIFYASGFLNSFLFRTCVILSDPLIYCPDLELEYL